MCLFLSVAVQLMREFDDVQVSYMPRECNRRADYMDKIGSGSKPPINLEGALVTVREDVTLGPKTGFVRRDMYYLDGG